MGGGVNPPVWEDKWLWINFTWFGANESGKRCSSSGALFILPHWYSWSLNVFINARSVRWKMPPNQISQVIQILPDCKEETVCIAGGKRKISGLWCLLWLYLKRWMCWLCKLTWIEGGWSTCVEVWYVCRIRQLPRAVVQESALSTAALWLQFISALPLKFQPPFSSWNAGRTLWLCDEASHTREPSFIFQTQKAAENGHLFPGGFVWDRIVLRGVGRSQPWRLQ